MHRLDSFRERKFETFLMIIRGFFIILGIGFIVPYVIGTFGKFIYSNAQINYASFVNLGIIQTYLLGLIIIFLLSIVAFAFLAIIYFCVRCNEYIRTKKSRKIREDETSELEIPIPIYQ